MTVLPIPTSTYQLLRDAAHAWPDTIATRWIPDPARYTDCLTWTYSELAARVTHLTRLIRRTGSVVVVVAGPELDEALWGRLLAVCAGVGVRAVLAPRPDAATGAAPPLPADVGMVVPYLDDLAAAQPADRLVGAQPPALPLFHVNALLVTGPKGQPCTPT